MKKKIISTAFIVGGLVLGFANFVLAKNILLIKCDNPMGIRIEGGPKILEEHKSFFKISDDKISNVKPFFIYDFSKPKTMLGYMGTKAIVPLKDLDKFFKMEVIDNDGHRITAIDLGAKIPELYSFYENMGLVFLSRHKRFFSNLAISGNFYMKCQFEER